MELVVTGGRGFIGSHFVELALALGHSVIDFDCMSYCSNEFLPFDEDSNYRLIKKSICDINHIPSCDVLVNFAAETHVDNSINDTEPFLESNVIGVHNLLEIVRGKPKHDRPVFFHISTDEVYGDKPEGGFLESDRLKPSNPYSASKAAAEMFVIAYSRTYGIDFMITRSSNNYGPRQYYEKLIPRILKCIKTNKKIPLHGDGSYVRDWIYVKDNANAVMHLIDAGIRNEILNIGANNHLTNLEVTDQLLESFGKDRALIKFTENRWGQDLRYSLDTSKINSYGWHPEHASGIFKWWEVNK